MKKNYFKYNLTGGGGVFMLSLMALLMVIGASEPVSGQVPVEALDGLKIQLTHPNVSGVETLGTDDTNPCYYSFDENELSIVLSGLKNGARRLTVKCEYGTNTYVLAIIDCVVSDSGEQGEAIEIELPVVKTVSDGAAGMVVDPTPTEDSENPVASGGVYSALAGKADASVYAKDDDENAHITKPLIVIGSVQEGSPYDEEIFEFNVVVLTSEQKAAVEAQTGTAYDYCDTNDAIRDGVNVTIYADEECTQKVGSTAKTEYADIPPVEGDFFNLQDGESIVAGTYYARVERRTIGDNSHAEGLATTASGINSHAEGSGTVASRDNAHAEGSGTVASGINSHAEGNNTIASTDCTHAEGNATIASGINSHAEGVGTTASGDNSHAEGVGTTASGINSHAEGLATTASRDNAHAEGSATTASGINSHAEGNNTKANGTNSHAEGEGTIASSGAQHVSGRYNVEDTNYDYALIVGNGASDQARSNAFAIDWNGNLVLFNAGTPVVLTPAKLAALIA